MDAAVIPDGQQVGNRSVSLLSILCLFEVVLMLSTRRLWFGLHEFPVVPLFDVAPSRLVLQLASAILMMAATCVGVIRFLPVTDSTRLALMRLLCCVALGAGGVAIVCNQQCLQAWHWFFLMGCLLFVLVRSASYPVALRQLISCVYVCAALSRLHPNPEEGPTGMIVLELLSIPRIVVSESMLRLLCFGATGVELLAGAMLLFCRSKGLAVILAMAMHLSLLVALGPFGLNHHAGVLFWNCCFLCVLPVLIRDSHLPVPQKGPAWPVLIVWCFSVSGLFGLADNWPSWQLYSSRPEAWELWVRLDPSDRVPESLKSFVSDETASGLRVVRLDRWSLEATGSPIYPEDRFQAAVIQRVLEELSPAEFAVHISEPQFPRWWERSQRTIHSTAELDEARHSLLPARAAE